jgi:hypothetical protein
VGSDVIVFIGDQHIRLSAHANVDVEADRIGASPLRIRLCPSLAGAQLLHFDEALVIRPPCSGRRGRVLTLRRVTASAPRWLGR